MRRWKLRTRTVHIPSEDKDGALSPPIYQTSTFVLSSADEGASYASSIHPERYYTRWGNPTVNLLEGAVADLEEGDAGLATSSGMGAISVALLTALKDKKHVVASKTLYSATHELLTRLLNNYGVRINFVDPNDLEGFNQAVTRDTGAVYIETPSNPTLEIMDIKALAEVCEGRCMLIVDNTFATPYNQRPLRLGATVVIHSSTKYLSGHFDVTGGIIVSEKGFIKDAWKSLKLLGTSMSPFDAWLTIRGLRTLSVRMEKHNENAMRLALFLENHDNVKRVMYPGLKSHPHHGIAVKQMEGFGGMLSFELKGGYQAGKKFVESLELCKLAVSLGGVQTILEHPASMSHAPLLSEERKTMGITDGLIRISVGIEDPDDIITDIAQALDVAGS